MSPFLSMVMKSNFSWDAFLNVWKRLLFTGDGFAGVQSIDSGMLSLKRETFFIWHSDSEKLFGLQLHRCDFLFRKLWRNFFFCFVSFAHAHSTSKSKSAYFYLLHTRKVSKSGFGKFWHKSFSYSSGKSERSCLLVVVVS